MHRLYRITGITTIAFTVGLVILIFLSWLLSSAGVTNVHSMLSSEAIRWFFGRFVENLSSPLLVWMILITIAIGACDSSNILKGISNVKYNRRQNTLRDRSALMIVFIETVIFIIALLLLTVVPHAILLNIRGEISNSSFSHSIVPVTAFYVTLVSVSYGYVSGRIRNARQLMESMTSAFSMMAPLFVVYIFAIQFFVTMRYVFSF